MPPLSQPVVLTIAGFDPCSGAGITADVKTIAAQGCYGIACITALTVQSTTGVRRVEPISGKLISQTLNELNSDFEIAATRIGMLGSGEVVAAVADFLRETKARNVVLDPVFKSSSGTKLLDDAAIRQLKTELLPLATVVTPNVHEATVLTGLPVNTINEMKAAAAKLHEMGARNVVVTGGHLERAIDLLSVAGNHHFHEQTQFSSERLRSSSTHGTGCAFASALAANLALGKQLYDAVVLAKAFVKKAIVSARPLGKGEGPLNHLYRLEEQPRPVQDSLAAGKEH